jgi:hypothetical protein
MLAETILGKEIDGSSFVYVQQRVQLPSEMETGVLGQKCLGQSIPVDTKVFFVPDLQEAISVGLVILEQSPSELIKLVYRTLCVLAEVVFPSAADPSALLFSYCNAIEFLRNQLDEANEINSVVFMRNVRVKEAVDLVQPILFKFGAPVHEEFAARVPSAPTPDSAESVRLSALMSPRNEEEVQIDQEMLPTAAEVIIDDREVSRQESPVDENESEAKAIDKEEVRESPVVENENEPVIVDDEGMKEADESLPSGESGNPPHLIDGEEKKGVSQQESPVGEDESDAKIVDGGEKKEALREESLPPDENRNEQKVVDGEEKKETDTSLPPRQDGIEIADLTDYSKESLTSPETLQTIDGEDHVTNESVEIALKTADGLTATASDGEESNGSLPVGEMTEGTIDESSLLAPAGAGRENWPEESSPLVSPS